MTYRHDCTYIYKDCNIRIDGMIIEKIYRVCNTQYRRLYTTYGHRCKALCYSDIPCPLYTEPCEVSYNHSKYNKLCHKPYALYTEDYSWSCLYYGRCLLLYTVPCDLLLYLERCVKILAYRHRCPSIYKEICLSIVYY